MFERGINLTRTLLTGAIMFATLFMVALNAILPDAASAVLTSSLMFFLAVLIIVGLFVMNVLERRWSQQQSALQAAVADNAALMQRITQRADQLTTLNQVSALLTQTLSTSDVLDSIVSSAGLIAHADAVVVYQVVDGAYVLSRDAGLSLTDPATMRPLTPVTSVDLSALAIADVQRDPRIDSASPLRGQSVRTLVELPFMRDGCLLGVLGCYYCQLHTFSEDELDILMLFAAQLSNALQNASRYERTDQQREVASTSLQAVLDAREAYTQMIVHDLRSPLTAVSASMKLVIETVPKDSSPYAMVERLIETGTRSLRKVLVRIDTLLDIAKMESGTMVLHREPTLVAALIQNVIAELIPLATELGITIETETDDLPLLMLDGDKIERTILNLVDNALKYAPMNSRIHVRALADTEHLLVEVSDHGKGVPDAYKEILFDRFVQIEGRQVVRRGVGLGLSFCKAVTDAHGGDIWIEDNPDGGSRFMVRLPLVLLPTEA